MPGQASREDVGIPNAGFRRRVTQFCIAEDALRGSCRPRRRAALVNVRKHARAHWVQVRLADVNHGLPCASVRKSPAAGGRWSPAGPRNEHFLLASRHSADSRSSCWGGFT